MSKSGDPSLVRSVELQQTIHTLNLIKESGVGFGGMTALHGGHLSALLEAAKENRLPPLTAFRVYLQRPVGALPVWATIKLGEPAVQQLGSAGFATCRC